MSSFYSPPPTLKSIGPGFCHGASRLEDSPANYSLQDLNEIITCLHSSGVRVLCVDFDFTMLRCHTGGNWLLGLAAISLELRDVFRDLVPLAIARGIYVAVVTFSGQTALIRAACESWFPGVADQIIIRGE